MCVLSSSLYYLNHLCIAVIFIFAYNKILKIETAFMYVYNEDLLNITHNKQELGVKNCTGWI